MAKREQYFEVRRAAMNFCAVAYKGIRIQCEEEENMVADWVLKNASERYKSSKWAVIRHNVNLGTRKYPNVVNRVELVDLSVYHEKEKTFRSDSGRYYYKSDIIGWLS